MTFKRYGRLSISLLFFGLLIVSFQNCGKQFAPIDPVSSESNPEPAKSGNNNPDNPPTPPTTVTDTLVLQQPSNSSVVEGQTARFSVSLLNPQSNVQYQWYEDDTPISDATGSVLEIKDVSSVKNQKQYSVRISLGNQSVISNKALLSVFDLTAAPVRTETTILPSETDPEILDDFGSYYTELNSSVDSKGLLFLFFPASLSKPENDKEIIRSAADNGFHSVGFAYPNKDVVNVICGNNAAKDCQRNVREETYSGTNVSTNINVNYKNSITNRLIALLSYLNVQRPNENWNQFLDSSGKPVWSKIRLSGHSQGGGFAGYIAYKVAVDRVCTFSSPADFDTLLNEPSDWLFDSKATESKRFYGLAGLNDNIVPWSDLQLIWKQMGLDEFGAALDIEPSLPSALTTHMLYTSAGNAAAGHNIGVVDKNTPRDTQGFPKYLKAWQYLCFK